MCTTTSPPATPHHLFILSRTPKIIDFSKEFPTKYGPPFIVNLTRVKNFFDLRPGSPIKESPKEIDTIDQAIQDVTETSSKHCRTYSSAGYAKMFKNTTDFCYFVQILTKRYLEFCRLTLGPFAPIGPSSPLSP